MNQDTVLIISVGGSPEPIVKSLLEHRASEVVFFASEQTIESIGQIKERTQEAGLMVRNRNVMVSDPDDLVHCYERALACADRALEQVGDPRQVVVDFTGGTKVMSAALTLASVGRGFRFSYVGGTERSKGGRGIVQTGSEVIVRRDDPFAVFLVEERKRLAACFASYQFPAAVEILRSLAARVLTDPDRLAFEVLSECARGYEAWERFEYGTALRFLKKASRAWAAAVQANPGIPYASLLSVIQANVEWLERLQEVTHQWKRYDRLLVEDFLANAARRGEEGRYDDAVVRLYRALELGAQVAVQRVLGCGTDAVPAVRVPEHLQETFRQRGYGQTAGVFTLPLRAAYELLVALGEQEGVRFAAHLEEFKKVQSARNHSWLAHGKETVGEDGYRRLYTLTGQILELEPRIRFPRLER